jgi:hypothetical protein
VDLIHILRRSALNANSIKHGIVGRLAGLVAETADGTVSARCRKIFSGRPDF